MSIMTLTRRGFLRGCCVLAGTLAFGAHWTGRAVAGVLSVRDHMIERIGSVYREDKLFPTRCSQDNEQVKLLYQKFLEKPLSEKAEHLLHTKWFDRSKAVSMLRSDGVYPTPRGSMFRKMKYPHDM
ncbi:MAG: iron hydrogenase small subunit [Mailhella sp.]|nr:iron hydrogenase small subunit [Mailhella sp.]